ncbi:hypothetical protein [Sphingomonas xinjiangensis]|uniref:Uncharacterized protein n=1 Tax=Sphingomonas xinjiangensis TaxID=643568 RepID=A0A840YAQ6_9SPHN|nr:hypothetical protein [Sphingomonas xinjiangensis]MBB5709934.1 hypothetical protein [Sphingomonas xinjiangensis]
MTLPVKTESPSLVDTSTIPGWGVDADPRNDPTYPMRDQTQDHGLTRHWDRPPIQHPDVEILQSIEHIRQPAVVGTSTPPSGLSGVLRRTAFRWSESNWIHWLMLMGADRINVVEGVVADLAHARLPNIPGEMGIRSELAYNKRGFTKKVAVVAGVSLAISLLARGRRARKREDGTQG